MEFKVVEGRERVSTYPSLRLSSSLPLDWPGQDKALSSRWGRENQNYTPRGMLCGRGRREGEGFRKEECGETVGGNVDLKEEEPSL